VESLAEARQAGFHSESVALQACTLDSGAAPAEPTLTEKGIPSERPAGFKRTF
jgi:hypothetical protein